MNIRFSKVRNEEAYDTVSVMVDGVKIGDDLDDNSYEDDGFRFHDLFHIGLYKYFNIQNGIYEKFKYDITTRSYQHKMEECAVLLMFEYSKMKQFKKLTHIEMEYTIIYILNTIGVDVNKYELRTFMRNTYDAILKCMDKFGNYCDDAWVRLDDDFKINVS